MVTLLKRHFLPVTLVLLSIFGAALIFYSTVWGPWAYSDSAAYLASARNLISGNGFGFANPDGSFNPFTYYPPLYPLLLTIPGLLKVNMVVGASLLDILFFALTILVVTWGSSKFLPHSWSPIAIGGLILSSFTLVDAFSSMMSEPVFILTGYSCLVALLFFIRSERPGQLYTAALFAALAMLSRYIGIVFLVTGVLAIVFFSRSQLKIRVRNGLVFGAIAIVPIAIDQVWVYLHTASIAGRSFILNATMFSQFADYIRQVIGVMNGWLPLSETATAMIPPAVRVLAMVVIGLAVYLLTTIRLKSVPVSQGDRVQNLLLFNNGLLLFTVCYLVGLGLSYSLSTPPVAIDNRMLSPLLPAIFCLVAGLAEALFFSFPIRLSRWIRVASVGMVLVVVLYSGRSPLHLIQNYHASGRGFTASIWHEPGVLDELQQLPAGTRVISNDPALMLFYLNWFPNDLSGDVGWTPTQDGQIYGQGSSSAQQFFHSGALLVLFMPRWNDTFGDQAQSHLAQFTGGLLPVYRGDAYQIFRYPDAGSTSTRP